MDRRSPAQEFPDQKEWIRGTKHSQWPWPNTVAGHGCLSGSCGGRLVSILLILLGRLVMSAYQRIHQYTAYIELDCLPGYTSVYNLLTDPQVIMQTRLSGADSRRLPATRSWGLLTGTDNSRKGDAHLVQRALQLSFRDAGYTPNLANYLVGFQLDK